MFYNLGARLGNNVNNTVANFHDFSYVAITCHFMGSKSLVLNIFFLNVITYYSKDLSGGYLPEILLPNEV